MLPAVFRVTFRVGGAQGVRVGAGYVENLGGQLWLYPDQDVLAHEPLLDKAILLDPLLLEEHPDTSSGTPLYLYQGVIRVRQ